MAAPARRELLTAYRSLLWAARQVHPSKFHSAPGQLERYIAQRVRVERELSAAERRQGDGTVAAVSTEELEQAAARMRLMEEMCGKAAALSPEDAPAFFSFFTATQSMAGSPEYHRKLEEGVVQILDFHDVFRQRVELEEERGGETKNVALQMACRELALVLEKMETQPLSGEVDAEDGEEEEEEEGTFLSFVRHQWPGREYREFRLPEQVLVENDPQLNKTTIFIASHVDVRDNAADQHVDVQEWACEPEGALFHAEQNQAALRIVRSLVERGAIPRGNKVALAGHSVGGAVAVLTAAYLKAEHAFDVYNVVTFGQPMVTTTVGCTPLMQLPILRITTPLDGFTTTPTFSHAGHAFVPYGERLSVLPGKLAEIATPEWVEENLLYVTMQEYNQVMNDDTAVLQHDAAPEYLAKQAPSMKGQDWIDQEEFAETEDRVYAPNKRSHKKRR